MRARIIWENTRIGSRNEITDSIIGANCIIGDRGKISCAVIADDVTIKNDISISKGTRVWSTQIIETSFIEAKEIK